PPKVATIFELAIGRNREDVRHPRAMEFIDRGQPATLERSPNGVLSLHHRNGECLLVGLAPATRPLQILDYCSPAISPFASTRSGVSNPSVNQPYIGMTNSNASLRRPLSRARRARHMAERNSKDLACCSLATMMALRKQRS